MKFVDMIKKSVLAEFTGNISVGQVILSLLVAFIIGVFIIYIYRKTFNGVVYSKSFSLCIILLAMVTCLIIRTISSNLALSLGMVGALSIVRFRTAVKDPVDTGFMFWAITAGIMAGAGVYLVAIFSSLCVGLLYFMAYLGGFKTSRQYLLILKYNSAHDHEIARMVKKLPKYRLKSKSIINDVTELTFEVDIKGNDTAILDNFKDLDYVTSASIISYQNDFGA